LGTLWLVLGGCGSAVLAAKFAASDGISLGIGFLGVALAFGLTVLTGVYAFGTVSGGHFNPAVTFAFLLTRRMSAGLTLLYWVAQILGAIVAAWLLAMAYHNGAADAHLGAPVADPSIRPGLAALLEGIAAFMLVIVVFGSAVDRRAPSGFAGLAIGLTVTANILMGGVLTGMAFNPARAFGPALVAGFWQDQWVYWVGPLLGGGVAGILYDRLFLERA